MKNVIKKIFNWESLGVICQVLFWALIIIILVVFLTVGVKLDEFRYVGF